MPGSATDCSCSCTVPCPLSHTGPVRSTASCLTQSGAAGSRLFSTHGTAHCTALHGRQLQLLGATPGRRPDHRAIAGNKNRLH